MSRAGQTQGLGANRQSQGWRARQARFPRERGKHVPRRLCGGEMHRGVLGVMFWLGPHVGMALPFREEEESIP